MSRDTPPLLSEQLMGLGLFAGLEETRRAAQVDAAGRKHEVYGRILADLRTNGAAGADTIAQRIDEHFMYVRPRISELLEARRIQITGRMSKSALGHPQSEVEVV